MVIGFLFIYDRGDECGWFGPDKAVRHLKSVVDYFCHKFSQI